MISGSSRLSVDGADVPRSNGPGRPFLVPRANGARTSIEVRARGYDYVPAVLVDGAEIQIAPRLSVWEYVLAAAPLLLVFAGGLVGFIVGSGAMAVNQWLLRRPWPLVSRLGVLIGVSCLALGATFLLVLAAVAILDASGLSSS